MLKHSVFKFRNTVKIKSFCLLTQIMQTVIENVITEMKAESIIRELKTHPSVSDIDCKCIADITSHTNFPHLWFVRMKCQ